MADTHKSIQSESESNASELSLSVEHRLLRMDTTYLIQILEMPKQKMQLKSMKSKSTRVSMSLTAPIPTILTKTGRQKIHH
jgi:hypothetical protein